MQWFGPASWGAPVCEPATRTDIPVGSSCSRCDEPIGRLDEGFVSPGLGGENLAFHYECWIRGIIGGANHQTDSCTCCGGSLPPDTPGLTVREAARLAVIHHERRSRRGGTLQTQE